MFHVLQWRQRVRRSFQPARIRPCLCIVGQDKLWRVIVPRLAVANSTSNPIHLIIRRRASTTGASTFREMAAEDVVRGRPGHGITAEIDRRPGHPISLHPESVHSDGVQASARRCNCLNVPTQHSFPTHVSHQPNAFPPRSNPVQPISTISMFGLTTYYLGCGRMLSRALVTTAALSVPQWPV